MSDIKLLVHIQAPREKVYDALTTIRGLSHWWTTQTTGECKPGGVIQFRFGTVGNDMKVISAKKGEWLQWECIAGPEDWLGTRVTFQLNDSEGRTRVRFEHGGWKHANDFFAGCGFTWGRYLESLRQYCQTGKGEAFGSEGYRQ
jgi:uncharacterized protein YndB with AHSA1/START domain